MDLVKTTNDVGSWQEEFAGYGSENVYATLPWMSLIQSVSKEGLEMGKRPGEFWHKGLQKSFPNPEVILLGWQDVMCEKGENGRTVQILHSSSQVESRGKGKDFKLINPLTGRRVDKGFALAMVIKDEPNSFCLFNPSVKSGENMRKWRSALSMSKLPSGNRAPLFGYSWILSSELRKDTNEYYVVSTVKKGSVTSEEYFDEYLRPVIAELQPHKTVALLESAISNQNSDEEVRDVSAEVDNSDEIDLR